MYTNSQFLYYSLRERVFFDPYNSDIPVTSIDFVSGDSTNLIVQFVPNTDGLTINSDNTVPSAYYVDMSAYPLFTFGIKTRQSWQSGSAFTQAFVQYNTSSSFYNPTSGSFDIPIGIVNSTSGTGSYVASYKLMTASGSAMTISPFAPLECDIQNPVIIGTEPVPQPIPSNIGTATILSGSNSVTVPFANVTPTATIFVSWLTYPWSTLGVIAGTGSFNIISGGPLSQNAEVSYNIYSLS